eukprot:2767599-Amphidinium_carterae.1
MVPLMSKEGVNEDGKLAFVLPHELLHCLFGQAGHEALVDHMGLDETTTVHAMTLSMQWGEPIVPV